MRWRIARGHELSIVSLAPCDDGGDAYLGEFGLTNVPTLQVTRQHESDGQLLHDVVETLVGGAREPAHITMTQAVRSKGMRQGLHEWVASKKVAAFVRRQNPDVLEAHWATQAASMAMKVKHMLGVPFTVTMHGGDLYRAPSPSLPKIVLNGDAIFPVSQFLVDLLTKAKQPEGLPTVPDNQFDRSKLRIRANSIDEELIADAPADQHDGVMLVGNVGRLAPEKCHADLIDAFANVKDEFPIARLQIIGGGPLEDDLRNHVKQLGIEGRVELTGAMPTAQVVPMVRKMNVYVQSADLEGFGLATLEAAGQGLPVIATRTGAHTDIIEPGTNGLLYDAHDVNALTQHLRTLMSDADLRRQMGKANLQVARERYASEVIWARTERWTEAIAAHEPMPQ
ncbi:MAG: glycosyltransferase family 4 protein [Phycisphaeraceae bacterium]|nr:glycosyltransferase family 4 protein [Phycisphaeraceae bacterium]